jgi:hypothetical protein
MHLITFSNWVPELPYKRWTLSLRHGATELWEDSPCSPFHLMNNKPYFLFLKNLFLIFVNWHWSPVTSFLVGLCACYVVTLTFEPCLQFFLLRLFWRYGLTFSPSRPGLWSSYFMLLALLGWQVHTTMPSFSPLRWVSIFFCPGWLETVNFLISESQIAKITSVRHWCLARMPYS